MSEMSVREILDSSPLIRCQFFALFRQELMEEFASKGDDLFDNFVDLFEEEDRDLLNKLCEDMDSETPAEVKRARDSAWYWLCARTNAMDRMNSLARNTDLYEFMWGGGISPAAFRPLMNFLDSEDKLEKIAMVLEPMKIIEYLEETFKKSADYERLAQTVRECCQAGGGMDAAARRLIREMPIFRKRDATADDEWYWDFMNACLSHPYTRCLPDFIDPGYATGLDEYNIQLKIRQAPAIRSFNGIGGVQVVEEDDPKRFECRLQEDYEQYRQVLPYEIAPPEEVILRSYQSELVESAIRGENTIVCAPTGSGKTVVAVKIIQNHLNLAKEYRRAVAMLVPTVPLVEQQCKMLNEYFRRDYYVVGISGAEYLEDRANHVLAAHITVFTPQIIVNMLKSIRQDERLNFADFTLIIFDECHHCNENHPYNVLMQMLHDLNVPSGIEFKKPQIIGLTASLGVGAGCRSPEAALAHMIKICANLSTYTFSTVRNKKREMLAFVRPPVDLVERVDRNNSSFSIDVNQAMLKIESELQKKLFPALIEHCPTAFSLQELRFPADDLDGGRYSLKYEQFMGNLTSRLKVVGSGDMKMRIMKSLDHLKIYHQALAINDLLPATFALEYMENEMEKIGSVQSEARLGIIGELLQIYKAELPRIRHSVTEENINEKKSVARLLEVLREQYAKKADSRTIIFVTKRSTAQMLSRYLRTVIIAPATDSSGSKRPVGVGFVTSSNQSGALFGQAAEEQRDVLRDFEDGRVLILVATAVAEEGLDIAACNLIVKYNNTGSERSLIQRRGRARALDSKSILIAMDGSVEQREIESMQKEALMGKCIEHLQSMSIGQIKHKVEEKMLELKNIRRDEQLRLDNKRKENTKPYDLLCKSCNIEVVRSDGMRRIQGSHYVICDPTIWERVGYQPSSKPGAYGLTINCGKTNCKNCGNDFGPVVKYAGTYMPTLKAAAIIISHLEELVEAGDIVERGGFKKWASIQEHVWIEELQDHDLTVMQRALEQLDVNVQRQMEESARAAAVKASEEGKRLRETRYEAYDHYPGGE